MIELIKKIFFKQKKPSIQDENVVSIPKDGDHTARWQAYHYDNDSTKPLRNLPGIKDWATLDKVEYRVSYILGLSAKRVTGRFDYLHLKNIHSHLFGKLYSWAGQERQINMYKSNNTTAFVPFESITQEAGRIFSLLKLQHFLSNIEDPIDFAASLCSLYLAINRLHPFREGNGRTQNEFIRQLALKNDYVLDIQSVF